MTADSVGWRRPNAYLEHEVALGKMTLEQALEKQTMKERVDELASLPRKSWPDVAVKWDLRRDHFRLSMDGVSQEQFEREFSVVLMEVDALALRKHLVASSVRRGRRFDGRYRPKTIELVAHLAQGGMVTPPIVKLVDGCFAIGGGNHRFWWARHNKQRRIPVLVHSEGASHALVLLRGVLIAQAST